MKTGALSLLLLSLSGCALAPGMKLDADAAERRAREGGEQDFAIEPVSPKLVQRLVSEAPFPPNRQDPLASVAASYQYTVAPYDVLQVTVWDHPELTIPAGEFRTPEATGNPVGADGQMFYPHVGVLHVAGKTLPEIRQLLTDRISRVIRDPQLDVRVAAFRGKRVQVSGEVTQPGAVPIIDVPVRVQDAISAARGFTAEADPSLVFLSRGGKTFALDMQAFYERGDLTQNWFLQDGDTLHVGDRRHRRVFVLGEVRQPLARPMVKGRMSLADALGDSAWLDPIAGNPAKIYVIRGSFDAPRVYHLDASSPDALLLATQFPMRPLDVVFVSTYEVARFNRVISQVLPSVSLLYQTLDLPNRAIDSYDVFSTGK